MGIVGVVGVAGGEGGPVLSTRVIRRSMRALALRIETAESAGRRNIGTGMRSIGPIGVVGALTEYLILGARGFVVWCFRYGSFNVGEGYGGRS